MIRRCFKLNKTILTKKESWLPNKTKKKIIRKKIENRYPWLNDEKYQIDDSFDTSTFNRLERND